MGDAAARAINNMTDAQAMPVCAPNGTASCPGGVVRIGVFFDGTNNNMYRDAPNDEPEYARDPLGENGRTNVAKLWELYIEEGTLQKRIYCHGVGTDSFQQTYREARARERPEPANPTQEQNEAEERANLALGTTEVQRNFMGNVTGRGGRSRVEWGRMQLADFYSNNGNDIAVDKLFDTYGFSRGAAIARDFVNKVRTLGIDNLKQPNSQTTRGSRRVPTYQRHAPPTPTFLGVWDTVGSFGIPGPHWSDSWNDYDFFVDNTYVKKTVHLIAEDEVRINFPVTSIFMDPNDNVPGSLNYQDPLHFKHSMVEIWYPGAHCDVGGAYLLRHTVDAVEERRESSIDSYGGVTERVTRLARPMEPGKRPDLAHIPLRDMHTASVKAKVPLRPLESLLEKLWKIPDDLARMYSTYDDYREAGQMYGVEKRYIHTFPKQEFRRLFWAERVEQENFKELKLHFIHDSAAEFVVSAIDSRRYQRTVHFMARQPTGEGPSTR